MPQGRNGVKSKAFWTERAERSETDCRRQPEGRAKRSQPEARRVRRPGGAAESIFEPLQNEEESGSFPVGESAERGEIFSPTPPGLFICGCGRHAFKKTAY